MFISESCAGSITFIIQLNSYPNVIGKIEDNPLRRTNKGHPDSYASRVCLIDEIEIK